MRFHLKLKHVAQLLLLMFVVWALWPTRQRAMSRPGTRVSRNSNARYVIRVAPQLYMPGSMPQNVGKPLEGFNKVADDFEALFPDTRIEFVNVPSGQREWLVTQLSAEQAPDIFQVNVEDVWQDVQKGWYVPLDQWLEQPNPFVAPGAPGSRQWWDLFKYQAISRAKAAPNGRMYCITYDMVETAVFYNKDIFRKLDLRLPNDWSEFMDIHRKLKAAGYTPMITNGRNIGDWGVDLIFDQLYYSLHELTDLHNEPARAAFLKNYLDWDEIAFLHKKGFFTEDDPRWVELWRILKKWRPYMSQDMTDRDMMTPFIKQTGAMYWSASWEVNKLVLDPDVDFDWGVFYLPQLTTRDSRFASNVPQCIIGEAAMQYSVSNSALKDTDPSLPLEQRMSQSQRLKRCIAFLQFMTTPKQANRTINELMCFLPNIVGVEPHKELLPFAQILKRRYTSTKWAYTFDLKFADVLTRGLLLYMDDGVSEKEFVRWMSQNVTEACDNITRRKNLNFDEYEKIWQDRLALRQSLPGLPAAAR
jgi:raffinose/stachyose/melibiose transport system substrate-binding protein